ncbi:hypothetical protein DEU56DRAFT_753102 [Suillus clintonianus]|uniref:uncharacterized protein n=1 Tax=Suillus clintonianus TaxID=1904413 RepID=UPI001B86ECA4|nr:uncharacterized protein DEU56DRAFT_753102 [Suillus clintonianus]KAG2148867.1 hypothetical protein DEU56DRAFT_753102 [Suillus clintonianus]
MHRSLRNVAEDYQKSVAQTAPIFMSTEQPPPENGTLRTVPHVQRYSDEENSGPSVVKLSSGILNFGPPQPPEPHVQESTFDNAPNDSLAALDCFFDDDRDLCYLGTGLCPGIGYITRNYHTATVVGHDENEFLPILVERTNEYMHIASHNDLEQLIEDVNDVLETLERRSLEQGEEVAVATKVKELRTVGRDMLRRFSR